MKTSLMTILLFSMLSCIGQESNDKPKNLFGDTRIKGGYIGTGIQTFQLNNQMGYGFGGSIALNAGRKFNIGFAGKILATDVKMDQLSSTGDPYYYELGYGGILIEPMIASNSPVHLTFPVVLGAGGVAAVNERVYEPGWHYQYSVQDADYFFIINPGVNVELNLFRFMRLAAGVNYRLSSDYYLDGVKNNLNGLGGNVTLKLGWF